MWIFEGNTEQSVALPRTMPEERTMESGEKELFDMPTQDLTREQWDELGYNEAVPIIRETYTTYTTTWEKGEDLIYREVVESADVDEEAQAAAKAVAIRAERDLLLAESDWTQLVDSPLSDDEKTAWAAYRQELREVPQQDGFPGGVTWPEAPKP